MFLIYNNVVMIVAFGIAQSVKKKSDGNKDEDERAYRILKSE